MTHVDPLLEDYRADLDRVNHLLGLLEAVRRFPGSTTPTEDNNSAFEDRAREVYSKAADCHANIPVLVGSTILYLAGRFESFVRMEFEDLCNVMASTRGYGRLPRVMREALIRYTAEVIAEPRKFGHAELGRASFISVLAGNMADGSSTEINSRCLSITNENMRPETLEKLFERIEKKDIWLKVCEQAPLKLYFEAEDALEVKNKTTNYLNTLMDLRNRIAHPTTAITWPDVDQVNAYLAFLRELGIALSLVVNINKATERRSAIPRETAAVGSNTAVI